MLIEPACFLEKLLYGRKYFLVGFNFEFLLFALFLLYLLSIGRTELFIAHFDIIGYHLLKVYGLEEAELGRKFVHSPSTIFSSWKFQDGTSNVLCMNSI